MLESSDGKMVEYAGYLVANLIRKNEGSASLMIKCGVLDRLAELLSDIDKAAAVIQPISVFCLYDEGKKVLKGKNVSSILHRLGKMGSEMAKSTAHSILQALEG
jgi:hypothetical protein